jgi:hypothetical protein
MFVRYAASCRCFATAKRYSKPIAAPLSRPKRLLSCLPKVPSVRFPGTGASDGSSFAFRQPERRRQVDQDEIGFGGLRNLSSSSAVRTPGDGDSAAWSPERAPRREQPGSSEGVASCGELPSAMPRPPKMRESLGFRGLVLTLYVSVYAQRKDWFLTLPPSGGLRFRVEGIA